MVWKKYHIIVLSFFFIGLIGFSTIYSVSVYDGFAYEIEENSKSESSETKNSLEEELKESKILFGQYVVNKNILVVQIKYIGDSFKLTSAFLPETQTPPPEFV